MKSIRANIILYFDFLRPFVKKLLLFIKDNALKVWAWLLLIRHIYITAGAVLVSCGMLISPSRGYIPYAYSLLELKTRYSPLRLLIPAAILTVICCASAKRGFIKFGRAGKRFTVILWILSAIGYFSVNFALVALMSV